MKTILIALLIAVRLNGFSLTLKLENRDSIHYGFWGLNKTVYGNTTIIEAKGKKFRIGVFDVLGKGNDSIEHGGLMAIYYINKSEESTFYKKFDLTNSEYIKNLTYLLIEGELYKISAVNLSQLSIFKTDTSNFSVLSMVNFLDCLYNIDYFDKQYISESGKAICSAELLKKNKLNIIYCTRTNCPPCERMKYDMVKLAANKKVNMNFITESGAPFDSAYVNNSQKYFSKNLTHIKYDGYPYLMLFDGDGNFMHSISPLSGNVVDKLKSEVDAYK
jgi:hypothetical protein